MCFCDWLLVTNYLKNSLLCVYTTLFHPLSYELSLEPFLGYLNYISVLSSLTKIKIARVHVYVLIISCPNGRWCNGVSPPTSDSSHLLSTFFIQHAQLCGHLDEMAHVPVKPVAVATLVLLFSFCLKACASSFFFHPS